MYKRQELYRYQIRENSIENEKFTPKKMDCIATSQMMLDDIEKNYTEFVAAARSRYFAAQFHILAQINEDIPEKKIIINNIKKIRGKLIKDSSASVRVRGACLLSYFGFDFTAVSYTHLDVYKRQFLRLPLFLYSEVFTKGFYCMLPKKVSIQSVWSS